MTINVVLFLYLLIYFQVKHFVADFVLQNVWMLQKSRPGWDFVPPLAIHCSVHMGLTLAAVLYVNPAYWWLCILDFLVHFTMDRIKAGPRYLGRFHDMRSRAFWVSFGLDQMVHHLTHLWIAWFLVTHVA
jgi:hypothetical protein